MSKQINNNRFESGKDAIRYAERAGCTIRRGKGDHVVITAPNGKSLPVVDREMGKGLGCKVYKWFKIMGLLTILFLLVACVMGAM